MDISTFARWNDACATRPGEMVNGWRVQREAVNAVEEQNKACGNISGTTPLASVEGCAFYKKALEWPNSVAIQLF